MLKCNVQFCGCNICNTYIMRKNMMLLPLLECDKNFIEFLPVGLEAATRCPVRQCRAQVAGDDA
jgi:hypothetical protein